MSIALDTEAVDEASAIIARLIEVMPSPKGRPDADRLAYLRGASDALRAVARGDLSGSPAKDEAA